jgi:hypothetical protein
MNGNIYIGGSTVLQTVVNIGLAVVLSNIGLEDTTYMQPVEGRHLHAVVSSSQTTCCGLLVVNKLGACITIAQVQVFGRNIKCGFAFGKVACHLTYCCERCRGY